MTLDEYKKARASQKQIIPKAQTISREEYKKLRENKGTGIKVESKETETTNEENLQSRLNSLIQPKQNLNVDVQPINIAKLSEASTGVPMRNIFATAKQNEERKKAEWDAMPTTDKALDITGKVVGTPVAAVGMLGTGVAKAGESTVDALLGLQAISPFNPLKDNPQYKESIRKIIETPFVDKYIGEANREFANEYSYLPERGQNIAQTVGNMLPAIATGSALNAGMVPFGLQAGGASLEEALNSDATMEQAVAYGALSGTMEGLVETISGGIGGYASETGKKVIGKVLGKETIDRIAKNAMGKFGVKLLERGVDVFGEGAEEVVSTLIDPFLKRLTYDERAELATSKEALQSFIDGALASVIVSGMGDISNVVTNREIQKEAKRKQNIDTKTQNQLDSLGKVDENSLKGLENLIPQKSDVHNQIIPNEIKPAKNVNMEDTKQNDIKTQIESNIMANKYLSDIEKTNLIDSLGENISSDTENAVNELLKTVNEEGIRKKTVQIAKEESAKYKQYLKDTTELDRNIINTALDSVHANKSGRRTKEQWLSVAKSIGQQIYNKADTEIERYAYKTWQEMRPNQATNLNRQGKGYVDFKSNEWINVMKQSANEAKSRTQIKEEAKPIKNTQKPSRELAQGYKDIAERLGLEIVEFNNPNPNINGVIEGNKISKNVNSKQDWNTVYGHELTHRIETSEKYKGMAKEIMDSNVFRNYLEEEKGMTLEEYRKHIDDVYEGINHNTDSEIIAKFVEEKMFKDEKSINRLANENPTLLQKFKNWIDDLIVKFTGTQEEVELRKIENMYRKALEQARSNLTNTQNVAYSIKENNKGKFVKVDTDQDIFGDVNEKDYSKIAKMYMQDYLKGTTKLTSNDEAIIDRTGINKYTNPQQRTAYFDEKMFLAPELKNVLEIAEKVEVSEANKDNSKYDNWEYYKFDFEIGNRMFEGLINIGIDKNGYKHFYEINKIHPIGISSVSTNSTNRMYSNNSINQNDSSVNTQYAQENKNDTAGKEPAFSMTENKEEQLNYQGTNLGSGKPRQTGINVNNAYNKVSEMLDKYSSIYNESMDEALEQIKKAKDNPESKIKIYRASPSDKINSGDWVYLSKKQADRWTKTHFGRQKPNYSITEMIVKAKDVEWSGKNLDFVYLPQSSEGADKASFSLPENTVQDSKGRTLTKEQQEFFKDSKVRDENGNLLEVYHGTDADEFTVFDKELSDEDNVLGQGLYFTDNKTQGEKYGSKIYTTYLNIKNPFVINDLTTQALANEIVKKNPNADIIDTDYGVASNAKMTDYLIENGYDGIKAGKNVYVAFNSNQIKNVDNTKPTSSEDIRYSIEGNNITLPRTRYISEYARTLQESDVTLPEYVDRIQKEIEKGTLVHERITDKSALNYAENYIKENGWNDSIKHWDELIKRNKPMDKNELALGQLIYNESVQNKDTTRTMKMVADLVEEFSEAGRNLQSASLINKMTPDGRLYALERSVQKINQDLNEKLNKASEIKIPEDMASELLNATTEKQIDKAVEKIQQYIADQVPPTWEDKLNAWRYLAMLGNPRTHIRNIIGNAAFIPAVELKNVIGKQLERTLPQEERTKSRLTKEDKKLVDFAKNDFDKNQATIRGENKYDIKAGIDEKKTIFSNRALEQARKGNFALLEAEDAFFLKYRYTKAFAQAIKAKGITLEQIRNNDVNAIKAVNEARNYAINEAQKSTYRDMASVASKINKAKRNLRIEATNSYGIKKVGYNLAYLGLEGLVPFTKTPVNIIKRGIEYSPAGLAKGIWDMSANVKEGKVTASQAINEISAGLSGTAITGFGYLLASLGLITGGDEDKDKEQALKEMKGYQSYSLRVGNKTYTIDWSAPSSIPLFIGVELYNNTKDEDSSNWLNSLKNIAEPVVEMSMLQGINSTLDTMGSDSALGNLFSKLLTSYIAQYNPTLLGQIARIADPVRRTTYVNKNIPIPPSAQKFIQQQVAKIPFASKLLPSYKDQFGREQITDSITNRIVQNFLSPGYMKDIKEGLVEQGITELYEQTGKTSVIPPYASKSLTQDKKKKNLTAKEYDAFAKTRGKVIYKGLKGLFKDKDYKKLSEADKVKVVESIYDYGNNVAKSKVLKGFELEKEQQKIKELEDKGVDIHKYLVFKKLADEDGNGYISQDEMQKALNKSSLKGFSAIINPKKKGKK